jgi:hypothetical protein
MSKKINHNNITTQHQHHHLSLFTRLKTWEDEEMRDEHKKYDQFVEAKGSWDKTGSEYKAIILER